VTTRLEKHIDLSREAASDQVEKFDLMIVSNMSDLDDEIINAHLAGTKIESYDHFLISLHGRIPTENNKIAADYFSLKRISMLVMFYQNCKIVIEPVIACLMAAMISPAVLVIAALIRLTSKGPAIFKQVRTGHKGELFTLYKFRTMSVDAEKNGPSWWTPNDIRVTKFGKFLRTTHLDELPQLFNVILGDMSFVGPRPELPAFYESLKSDIIHFHLRTLIRPGITGWAQIKGGYANSIESSKIKLEFDLYYIFHLSPLLDLQIIVDTLTGNKVKDLAPKEISYETALPVQGKNENN
jgi:lipopolysaccharide/colanic/teichoic acid biosynthesis glycosyltransferase